MIFSELYCAYYNAVAHILDAAVSGHATERLLREEVARHAFSESVLTILPSLKSGRWQVLRGDLSTPLGHTPTMPLTNLQKQWLKAISLDPRIRLFGAEFPELDGVEPLFTPDDYRIYDRYSDGDPFDSEEYIRKFRLILNAVKAARPLSVDYALRDGRVSRIRLMPERLEYSEKDDKFRLIATGCRFGQLNLSRIRRCDYYDGNGKWEQVPPADEIKTVCFVLTDERNALERVLLHFAHLEKQVERIDQTTYKVALRYYGSDETEILIRLLSFGPFIRVTAPEEFVRLIKERLQSQKSCGLF